MTDERTLAGHRVLRLLAEGARSQVWLAAGDLVLKAPRAPMAPDQPESEIVALDRAGGEHVVELLDVSQSAGQAVLVFPRLPRGSLAELLSARSGWGAGEAVTVLAPLAACLTRMHRGGVAHAALTPAAVLFRADGAPMLTGFGSATLFGAGLPEVALEVQPGVAGDRAALARIADGVLSRVSGPRSREAARLADELREADPAVACERLGTDLFELAAARPVSFARDDPSALLTGRVGAVDPAVAIRVPEPPPDDRGPVVAAVWWRPILEIGPVALVRGAVRGRWASLSPRRRKVVLGLAAGAAVVIVAATVDSGPAPGGAPVAAPSSSPVPSSSAILADPAIAGDDPLAAAGALLEQRDRCFRDLSVLCLDTVGEPGSAALEADRSALAAILDGGVAPRPITADGAMLAERLGDAALVTLVPNSDPASLLLLKGEAGWRIRDYLPERAPPS